MSFDIHQGFKRVITRSYTAADGSPGVVEGIPVWTVSVPEVATLNVAADGMSAEVIWNGTSEGVEVTSVADGDLGTGVFSIALTDVFNFIAPLGATAGSTVVGDEVAV